MYYHRSKTDPYLFYYWGMHGLVLAICWVDDVLAIGNGKSLEHLTGMLKGHIDCEETGGLNEYLGCKID